MFCIQQKKTALFHAQLSKAMNSKAIGLCAQFLRFGIDSILIILNEWITFLINLIINDKGVYRTAPATQGLLIIWVYRSKGVQEYKSTRV